MITSQNVTAPKLTAGEVTDLWLDGGRGSLKSSFASLELVNVLMRDDDANALVMQRVGADIRNGSFAQVVWAMEQLGVADEWRQSASARKIERPFDYQSKCHCAKTTWGWELSIEAFDYQSKCHCAKTRVRISLIGGGFDYQSKCHCAKTQRGTCC